MLYVEQAVLSKASALRNQQAESAAILYSVRK